MDLLAVARDGLLSHPFAVRHVAELSVWLAFALVFAVYNSRRMDGVTMGTPAYMSPEQASGNGELDARSDIYCLGAVAYFLLTGQPPFVRDSAMRTVAAHLLEPLPSLGVVRADLPADLQAVVHRCLEKEPSQRFPDCQELGAALAACACAADWGPSQANAWWATRRDQAGTGFSC